MHNEIKRRLLREVVQANLAIHTAVPSSRPPPLERRRWPLVGRMLCLAAALVLLPIDDMSTVISTVIKQHIAVPRPPLVGAQRAEVAPLVPVVPPLTSEEVESPEPTFPAPVAIDRAVIPLAVKKIMLDPGHGGK